MNLKIKNALVSLSDKENIHSLLKIFKKYNIKIISSVELTSRLENSDMIVPNYQSIQGLKKC